MKGMKESPLSSEMEVADENEDSEDSGGERRMKEEESKSEDEDL